MTTLNIKLILHINNFEYQILELQGPQEKVVYMYGVLFQWLPFF